MSLTYSEAQDEILALFKTAWDAGGGGVTVIWADNDVEPPEDDPWVHIRLEHVPGMQGSLTGGLGTTRWSRLGLVSVDIRTLSGRGLLQNTQLGMVAADAFEGKTTPGGVWFRNVRYSEAPGRDGKWQQGNVVAEFTYDQIK